MPDITNLGAVNAVIDKSTISERHPRGMVRINGVAAAGWLDMEIESNTYREADTFTVTFLLSALVAPYTDTWFCEQTTINVELLIGFPADPENYGYGDLDSMLIGNVDSLAYDPVQRTLQVSGRDLTSLLIDAKTAEKWQNQTASEVAITLAKRHGLKPIVTTTTDTIGKFYQIDHVSTTSATTEWDFLCWVAQQTQFVVYVKGNELHFEPSPDPTQAPTYPITWTPATNTDPFQSNTKQLSFSRTLTVGKTISVTVRSWNVKSRKGFTASYPSTHGSTIKPGSATSPAQAYSYTIPNLTQEQAQKRAQALYNDIIKNEMRLDAAIPGDNELTALHVIPVSGTGTAFDQNYFPESITRRLAFNAGYAMDVRARNHADGTIPA